MEPFPESLVFFLETSKGGAFPWLAAAPNGEGPLTSRAGLEHALEASHQDLRWPGAILRGIGAIPFGCPATHKKHNIV